MKIDADRRPISHRIINRKIKKSIAAKLKKNYRSRRSQSSFNKLKNNPTDKHSARAINNVI